MMNHASRLLRASGVRRCYRYDGFCGNHYNVFGIDGVRSGLARTTTSWRRRDVAATTTTTTKTSSLFRFSSLRAGTHERWCEIRSTQSSSFSRCRKSDARTRSSFDLCDDDDDDERPRVDHRVSTTTTASTATTRKEPSSSSPPDLREKDHDEEERTAAQTRRRRRDVLMPLSLSNFLIGSSVGVINPVMPFVVQDMGLTNGEFGMVVSSFGLAKMVGNVPSAILVEKHGRKPYLVHSLSVIGLAVAGVGMATSLEHLVACRIATGLGVAALVTASTLTVTDVSTPRDRATTMAPINSAFAAGMCVGPAVGGELVDLVGVPATFAVVGGAFAAIAGLNSLWLRETMRRPTRPVSDEKNDLAASDATVSAATTSNVALRDVFSRQRRSLFDPRVRDVIVMNGLYWTALAGAQTTLLPLMLASPDHGAAMSASEIGGVYAGMALVQVLASPLVGRVVDRVGRRRAVVAGAVLLASSTAALPTALSLSAATMDVGGGGGGGVWWTLPVTMGVWALGGTVLSSAPVAHVSDAVSDGERATAIASLRTAGDVGFFVGALAAGTAADHLAGGLDSAMHGSAGVLLAAATWFGARLCVYGTHHPNDNNSKGTGSATTGTNNTTDDTNNNVRHLVETTRDDEETKERR